MRGADCLLPIGLQVPPVRYGAVGARLGEGFLRDVGHPLSGQGPPLVRGLLKQEVVRLVWGEVLRVLLRGTRQREPTGLCHGVTGAI